MYDVLVDVKDIKKFIDSISPLIIDTVGVEKALRKWLIEMGLGIRDIDPEYGTLREYAENHPNYFDSLALNVILGKRPTLDELKEQPSLLAILKARKANRE